MQRDPGIQIGQQSRRLLEGHFLGTRYQAPFSTRNMLVLLLFIMKRMLQMSDNDGKFYLKCDFVTGMRHQISWIFVFVLFSLHLFCVFEHLPGQQRDSSQLGGCNHCCSALPPELLANSRHRGANDSSSFWMAAKLPTNPARAPMSTSLLRVQLATLLDLSGAEFKGV